MIIFGILILCFSIFLHWKKNANLFPQLYLPALFIKLGLGCLLGIIYRHYYTGGDTFVLFNDATKLAEIAKEDWRSYINFITAKPYHWPEDIKSQLTTSNSSTVFFTILLSFISLITSNNYWVSSLYVSFFSFCGFWYLLKQINYLYPSTSYSFIIANLCIPSIVFWSSGIIKEAIAIPTIYFSLGIILHLINSKKSTVLSIFLLIINLYILSQIKFYYLGSGLLFFIPLLFLVYLDQNNIEIQWKYLIICLTVGGISIVLLTSLEYHLNIDQFPKSIYSNYQLLSLNESDPYAIHLPNMSATWKGIFTSMPKALIDNFLYPNFATQRHLFDFILSIENITILSLILGNVYFIVQSGTQITKTQYFIILILFMYALVTIALLTIASPNIGTLSRYKIGASVFLYYLLFMNIESKYWRTK